MTTRKQWKLATKRLVEALVASTLVTACEESDAEPGAAEQPCEELQVRPDEPLRWRREQQLLTELGRALDLPKTELCRELGGATCEDVHKVALGGNNPFEDTMFAPAEAPLPVTATTVDRVVLSGCVQRVERDAAGEAVVFTKLDLTAASLDAALVDEQVVDLFRRIRSRDPSPEEVDVISALATGTSATEFAVMACFAVAGTTELVAL